MLWADNVWILSESNMRLQKMMVELTEEIVKKVKTHWEHKKRKVRWLLKGLDIFLMIRSVKLF